jgi:hypothetical protein
VLIDPIIRSRTRHFRHAYYIHVIIYLVQSYRLRCIVTTGWLCVEDGENEKRITHFVGERLERPRRKWEDNITINDIEFCCDDRGCVVSDVGLRY